MPGAANEFRESQHAFVLYLGQPSPTRGGVGARLVLFGKVVRVDEHAARHPQRHRDLQPRRPPPKHCLPGALHNAATTNTCCCGGALLLSCPLQGAAGGACGAHPPLSPHLHSYRGLVVVGPHLQRRLPAGDSRQLLGPRLAVHPQVRVVVICATLWKRTSGERCEWGSPSRTAMGGCGCCLWCAASQQAGRGMHRGMQTCKECRRPRWAGRGEEGRGVESAGAGSVDPWRVR